jgi:hypothetical protein
MNTTSRRAFYLQKCYDKQEIQRHSNNFNGRMRCCASEFRIAALPRFCVAFSFPCFLFLVVLTAYFGVIHGCFFFSCPPPTDCRYHQLLKTCRAHAVILAATVSFFSSLFSLERMAEPVWQLVHNHVWAVSMPNVKARFLPECVRQSKSRSSYIVLAVFRAFDVVLIFYLPSCLSSGA